MLEVIPSPISKAAADQLLHVVDDDVGFLTSTDDDYCESFMVDDGDDNLFDYIDFTCCDVVPSFFDADGDILPDLEVDPTELLAEFEDHCHEEDKKGTRTQGEASSSQQGGHKEDENKRFLEEGGGQKKISGDEVLSAENTSKSSSEAQIISKKKKKPSKNSNGKRKVDWTPELHRRFVQAVEQLGIDKAVPSRILEIMGIECLTRHNIASHLQKYRSHRKHLMAREAEAASWAQKRQMYAAAAAPRTTTTKDIMPAPWVVPTVGFPPPPFGRPLHVWGHPPTAAPPLLPVWPRHLAPPPRPWAPVDPAAAPYWQQQQQCNGAMKWGPHAVPPTMMPSSTTAAMLPRFPVPGMMPHPMYRPPLIMPPSPSQTAAGRKLATLQLQLDAHPSKESIDAAIGDVLVKPWLPLPLGLKPPSLDSVMSELHRQGIPKIPPAATTTGS